MEKASRDHLLVKTTFRSVPKSTTSCRQVPITIDHSATWTKRQATRYGEFTYMTSYPSRRTNEQIHIINGHLGRIQYLTAPGCSILLEEHDLECSLDLAIFTTKRYRNLNEPGTIWIANSSTWTWIFQYWTPKGPRGRWFVHSFLNHPAVLLIFWERFHPSVCSVCVFFLWSLLVFCQLATTINLDDSLWPIASAEKNIDAINSPNIQQILPYVTFFLREHLAKELKNV